MNIPLNFNPLGFAQVSTPVEPELPEGYTHVAFLENAIDNNTTGFLPFFKLTSKPALPWVRGHVAMGAIVPTNVNNAYALNLYSGSFQGGYYVTESGAARLYYNKPNLTTYSASDAISGYNKTKFSWNAEEGFVVNNEVLAPQGGVDITDGWKNIALRFFAMTSNYGGQSSVRIYEFETGYEDVTLFACVPCVRPNGAICFYNTLTGAVVGAGDVLAGIETLKQLQQLASNLPTVTDTPEIKLSLPGEWNGDASANAQLNAINNKGWQATISYRDVETAASSSFVWGGRGDGAAARVVLWCKSVASESGNYQDEKGNKYYVVTCNDIWRSDGLTPDDLGYSAALDLASYLAENNLIPVEYPEEELNA